MRLRGNNLRVGSSALMGRRFLPPLTAVPVVMGEEPWRERPRLRAMNPSRARSRVVHATIPGGHPDVFALGRCGAPLSVQNAAQIMGRIEGRIARYMVVRMCHARWQTCVLDVVERRT